MVIRNGYMYVFQKILVNDVRCYECVLSRKVECKGKAKLGPDNSFLEQLNTYTHPPSRSTHSKVFLEKSVLKICSKFTGEYPC